MISVDLKVIIFKLIFFIHQNNITQYKNTKGVLSKRENNNYSDII